MEITTKFNVGEMVWPVWFSSNTKKYVTKLSKIVAIFISSFEKTYIEYTIDNGTTFTIRRQEMVFKKEEEAKGFLLQFNHRTWETCPLCNGDGFTDDGMDCCGCYGTGCFEDIDE